MHRDGFISSKITYELITTECHRTDFCCFIEFLFFALWCTEMHRDALRCTVMHRDGFISSKTTSKLHRVPPNWFLLLYLVPTCTVMHQDAPWCTEMHCDAPRCTVMHWDGFISSIISSELPVPSNWFLLLYWVLICTVMHRDAPWCTEMHCDAPRWLYFF